MPWFSLLVETITQFADQVRIRLFSQIIKSISRVLQIFLKYFNGTIISTPFDPSSPVWPVIFSLELNESVRLPSLKSIIASLFFTAGISLQYYHYLPRVFEYLSLYCVKLYIGTTISISLALSISILFILLLQSVNVAQFSNF